MTVPNAWKTSQLCATEHFTLTGPVLGYGWVCHARPWLRLLVETSGGLAGLDTETNYNNEFKIYFPN